MSNFRCPKCGKVYDLKKKIDFKTWTCEKCGWKAIKSENIIEFEKVGDKVKVINKNVSERVYEDLVKEIEDGIKSTKDKILYHEEDIEDLKVHIKTLEDRLKQIKDLKVK